MQKDTMGILPGRNFRDEKSWQLFGRGGNDETS